MDVPSVHSTRNVARSQKPLPRVVSDQQSGLQNASNPERRMHRECLQAVLRTPDAAVADATQFGLTEILL